MLARMNNVVRMQENLNPKPEYLKHKISEGRTHLVATRKKLEADRRQRLKPLWKGIRQTAALEVRRVQELAKDLAEKIEEDNTEDNE